MDIAALFRGPAVIIDDDVETEGASIRDLIDQLELHFIPCAKYSRLPDAATMDHFGGISFLLLDWRLIEDLTLKKAVEEGVAVPAGLEKEMAESNIAFLTKLKECCFVPVFIFTDGDPEAIKTKLAAAGLYDTTKPNFILVKSKADLIKERMFEEIQLWLKSSASVYVLKEWERQYESAKNRLFIDFFNLSHSWPAILWENSKSDGANESQELGEVISRNLHSRMLPFSFEAEILAGQTVTTKEEVRQVLEGERFISKENLTADVIGTGDLFYLRSQEYLLNIRPQCDLLRSASIDDVLLYCLKGTPFKENKINKSENYVLRKGQFRERADHAIVPFVHDGKLMEFLFKDLLLKTWGELKAKRIGRLLPPYITHIQQRYALYLQRAGLPRIPESALSVPSDKAEASRMETKELSA